MRTILVAAAVVVGLPACGGGGSSSAASVPIATPPPIQAASVQRADVAQALTSYSGTSHAASYSGAGGSSLASVGRSIDGAAIRVTTAYRQGFRATHSAATRQTQAIAYSACAAGLESAGVTVSAAEEQLYERVFYDAGCTKLYNDAFFDVIATSPTAGNVTGTATLYDAKGAIFDYQTLTLELTGVGTAAGSFSIVATDAPSATAAKIASLGVACNISADALGCGIGGFAREPSASQDMGAALTFNASVAVANGEIIIPVSAAASAYAGPLGSLSLAQATFPAFAVSGGSLLDSATLNGSFTYMPTGVLVSGSLTLTDAAADGTVTVVSSGSPVVSTGVVKQTSTGKVLATFTVDAAGNGTLTYSNGAVAQIANWQVFG